MQPEQILEEQLVAQLQTMGYAGVTIVDEKDLLTNLKAQLEKRDKQHHNLWYHVVLFLLRPLYN